MTAYIYALKDPRDGSVGYVGRTQFLANRRREHTTRKLPQTTRVGRWLAELRALGIVADFVILEEVMNATRATASEAERRWIVYYKGMGEPLCNAQMLDCSVCDLLEEREVEE